MKILSHIKKIKHLKAYKSLKHFKVSKNLALAVGAGLILFAGVVVLWLASFSIPDFKSFEDRKIVNSTKIYDKTGEILLYDIHQDVKRTNITFEQMGTNIKNATVAIEDAEFYNHNGVRITSTIRAVLSNIFGFGIGGGGSTITQQLVKNTLLNPQKTYGRKIKEWVLAFKIDSSMTKEKILELYLNEVPYGGTVYGIQEASKTYYNKNALDLTLAESAYLASIPQSPSVLSPYGKNRARLEDRKNLVLSRMKQLGLITEEDFKAARAEVVVFAPQSIGGIKAPHFVFFIKEYLEKEYGIEAVEKGGMKVITTLDYKLQEKAEKIVKDGATENAKLWNGNNASLVAIDPKTGQILTMVGSRDYFDKTIDGNFNVATASRQPGSSFKPFIYATAFNKGFTPDTVLFDLPTEFQTSCGPDGRAQAGRNQADCYMPQNYDGNSRGPMKLRDALGQSINVPAVKLFYLAGTNDSIKTAEAMGITTLSNPSRYGLTLVIGGGETKLLDMTSAYGVFANSGIRNPYSGILKVEDSSGNVLEEFEQKEKQILPKNTALTISDILSDNVARTPTFGANSVLVVSGRDVAVKTGTTNSNKDAWIVGYSPSMVVGVWAGNNDNTPMKKGGAAMAGPIWNKFISEALKTIPNEKFEEPSLSADPQTVKPILRGFWQGNENFFIDKISGKLATEFTPQETLVEKVVTNVHSILHWVDRSNITGPAPSDPSSNSQYRNWEAPVQNWWAQNRNKYTTTSSSDKPTEYDDVHTENSTLKVSVLEPNEETTYKPDEKIKVKLSSAGIFPLQKIDIFINDSYMGTFNSPFNFSFIPNDLENLMEENEFRVVSYDTAFNQSEASVIFGVK